MVAGVMLGSTYAYRFMHRLLLPSLLGLSLGALSALPLACSAGEFSDGLGGGGDYTSSGTGGDRDASIDVAPDGENPPGPVTYADYCGMGACVPSLEACTPGGLGGGGAGGAGGGGGDGGGGAAPAPVYGCQVTIEAGTPKPVCAVTGSGLIDAPCLASSDCSLGLACVRTDEGAGLCRPYCCGELEACPPSETYCALAPLFEDPSERIPVCAAVEACTLLAPGMCDQGEACAVVRNDGTTSCIKAGTGLLCDPCPCAAGYTCNFGTGRCEKLCETQGAGQCEGGSCQGGSSLPSGIGICIGGEAACDG